jgi:hypothetical protein
MTSVLLRRVCFFSHHEGGLSLCEHERILSHRTEWACINFAVDMKCLCSIWIIFNQGNERGEELEVPFHR